MNKDNKQLIIDLVIKEPLHINTIYEISNSNNKLISSVIAYSCLKYHKPVSDKTSYESWLKDVQEIVSSLPEEVLYSIIKLYPKFIVNYNKQNLQLCKAASESFNDLELKTYFRYLRFIDEDLVNYCLQRCPEIYKFIPKSLLNNYSTYKLVNVNNILDTLSQDELYNVLDESGNSSLWNIASRLDIQHFKKALSNNIIKGDISIDNLSNYNYTLDTEFLVLLENCDNEEFLSTFYSGLSYGTIIRILYTKGSILKYISNEVQDIGLCTVAVENDMSSIIYAYYLNDSLRLKKLEYVNNLVCNLKW